MKRIQGRFFRFKFSACTIGAVFLFAACSLEAPTRSARFFIDLSPENTDLREDPLKVLYPDFSFSEMKAPPPTGLDGFSCLAVNITGPGIPNTSGTNFGTLDQRFNATYNGQSFCSYRGIMKGPIFPQSGVYTSQSIEVVIPTGSPRLIQVVGVTDSAACAPELLGSGNFSSYGDGRFYEIGRAKVDTVFSDLSVTIGNQWPSTIAQGMARKMDCPDCGVLHASTLTRDGSETVSGSNLKLAQPFTVGAAGRRLSSVQFVTTTASATVANVRLIRNSGGVPSSIGSDILDSALSVSIPVGTNVMIQAPFPNGVVLDPGIYWIVIEQVSSSFDVQGNTVTTQGVYPAQRYNTGGPWVAATNLKTVEFRVVTCQ